MATKKLAKRRPGHQPRGARDPRANLTLVVNDATLNDSDKTFAVPAGEEWDVLAVYAELASTATAGNRITTVRFMDGSGNIVASSAMGVGQAALNLYRMTFAPGQVMGTTTAHGMTAPLPTLYLPAGYQIRVFDAAAIDAAADDLTVRITAQVRRP